MKIKNISIGADPELFIKNNDEVVSAEGIIGGSKKSPRVITKEGHAIQEDNVMVEFNIPASKSKNEFIDNINTVLSFLDMELSLKNLQLHYSASEHLDKKYLKTEQATTFGCEADLDVYAKLPNTSPSSNTTLRTAGGHIHIGYDNPSDEVNEYIVMAMDLFLGVPSIVMDEDDRRRTMYGKAGCFRFKPYGVEYRTLSNFWIYSDELKQWAYDSTLKALKFIENQENIDFLIDNSEKIQKCINNNNLELVNELTEQVKEILIKEKQLV